jgi:hypothetical protein
LPEIDNVVFELCRASKKFGAFNTAHEGLAVIREEYLELEDEVFDRSKHGTATPEVKVARMKHEAIQLAAMAVRFMLDVCRPERQQTSSRLSTRC